MASRWALGSFDVAWAAAGLIFAILPVLTWSRAVMGVRVRGLKSGKFSIFSKLTFCEQGFSEFARSWQAVGPIERGIMW